MQLHPGLSVFGGDADVDLGATGTLHATTFDFSLTPNFKTVQLSVSAITCPNGTSSSFSLGGCTAQFIDSSSTDRPWITSDGSHIYISYHDGTSSALIRGRRSDDDGATWQKVGDPIVGQDGTTGDATLNSIGGPTKADPVSHNVYAVYAAGETGVLEGRTFTPNHIIVSRRTDLGKSWTANLVYTAPPGTALVWPFPAIAVDPVTRHLYAAWSDGHTVSFSASSDQGAHRSAATSPTRAIRLVETRVQAAVRPAGSTWAGRRPHETASGEPPDAESSGAR